MMAPPYFLARPIFHIVYTLSRRKVKPVADEQRLLFDRLIDKALTNDHNALIDYDLPYPKADFLSYICDWRGFVAHGSPLRELKLLEPIRKSEDKSEFGNRQQIFFSPDGMWAMWFAILDQVQFCL